MKKAIVLGASSGIGKELARLLVKNGYIVGITGRRKNLLIDLKNENPDKYFIGSFDLTDTYNIKTNLESLVRQLDGVDLLIISSGTGDTNDRLDFEIEKRTIEVNVTGFTAVCDWAFNYFAEQKTGHIVGITSVAGIRGSRHAPSYNATKAYQINYLEGLHQKAKKLKSRLFVTDIRPGFVNTDMAKGDGLFWVANVEKAAYQIFKAIKQKSSVAYVTKRWLLVAILLKYMPKWIYLKM